MNKKMIGKIQERMNEIGAPGACACCPINLYSHLSPNKLKTTGCGKKWNLLCERLGIEYYGGYGCIEFYDVFMNIKVGRICKI